MQIKLKFLGAAQNVTGSRYLVEANDSRILVDCGLYQERDFRSRNWDPFPVEPKSIDAVLLTHSHLDHCGFLPKIVKEGFNSKIYCTPASAEIAKIVLLDSAHIQTEDAEFKKKRHQREGRKGPHPEIPLYTVEDAEATIPLFSTVKYETPVNIAPGIQCSFHDAGHILGSSMIKLTIQQDRGQRTIIFSGDIGRWETPILQDPSVFEQADYLLMESTYGNRLHEERDTIAGLLAEIINRCKRDGGNILIPSFSVERAQEVLYYLNELLIADQIPHLMVFLDSPMAISVTQVFKNHPELFDEEMLALLQRDESPFEFTGLKMTRTVQESKAINHVRGTIVIIAGSGMCTGGRIKHHLVTNITRPESTVLFVGYQAKGTLGRRIVDGDDEIRVLGQYFPVKAKIVQLHGFSAHADQNELIKWVTNLRRPPRQLFVTHGEEEVAQSFSELLRQKTGWRISTPEYQDQVDIE
ncbi:MAG TPA: MBL fold metallo-hydrolase [bacterium]|nr:MBL fold metallo-hydrolase [bacterium]